VPPRDDPAAPLPYPADRSDLLTHGTGDKLFIQGHYYSDKSPVPALLMACLYEVLQQWTGLTARERPDHFCLAMTLGFSGLAYVVAVWCLYRLGRTLRLARGLRLALTASFALGTVALPYARHVNNHLLLLAVGAGLTLSLARMALETEAGQLSWGRLVGLGTWVGLGYTIDPGCGPVLLVCPRAVLVSRCRGAGPVGAFVLAALPGLALHHAVTYAVGGPWHPANAVAAYQEWPGSSFHPGNLTGRLNHGWGHFPVYAAA